MRLFIGVLLFVSLAGKVHPQCSGFQCRSGSGCVTSQQYCDFIEDCADGSDEIDCPTLCTFDEGNNLCGWTQDTNDDFDWRVRDGTNTPPGYTGPAKDVTTGSLSGRYLFLDGTFTNVSSKSSILSPQFAKAARTCKLTLWYHFFGVEYGDLEIRQITNGNTKHLIKVLDKFPALLTWYYMEVFVDPCVENFRIILIGEDKQELPQEGGIAVDDIEFKDCAYGPPQSTCDEGYSQCSPSGVCYENKYQCDFTRDCCESDTDEQFCGDYKMCDFQEGFCNWVQLDDDDFDWTRHKGETGSDNTGPKYDHTTGTVDGYYIYIEISNVKIADSARIASYVIAGNPINCQLRFWYHMSGNFIGALTVYTREQVNGPLHKLWGETQDLRDPWNFKVLNISRENDFQVVFEANRGISVIGDISLDDISFSPGCRDAGRNLPVATTLIPPFTRPGGGCDTGFFSCDDGRCVRGDAYCDFHFDCFDGSDEADCSSYCGFEASMCGWTQDKSDDFDWKMRDNAADMDVDFKGPVNDHTYNTPQGNYLYVVGSTIPTKDRKARLISPTYHSASRACRFTFWYYMFGLEYGDLEVYIRTPTGGDRRIRKELDGYGQYGKWWQGEADIDACTSQFQIILEVEDTMILPVQSGFAIDDFLFTDCATPLPVSGGSCGTRQSQCSNGMCYASDQQCDFALDCCDGTDELASHCTEYSMCDFESGWCDWTNLNDDEFDWTRNNGGTGTSGTGPGNDHTLGTSNGYYLYIEVDNPRRPGDRARLGSYIILQPPGETCTLRFYYHMEGLGIGQLNVYKRSEVNGVLTTVWSRTQERGDNWFYASVGLGIETRAFQVVIEGVRGTVRSGDIAIDDVSFTPGCEASAHDLPVVSTVAYTGTRSYNPCNDEQFLCTVDYSCISDDRVCNGVWDCPQGTDEDKNCG
ncbi:MAM and LDL-receptor class A domain-containing protein 1 [Holothuria leucospilota]|uniref:MAM and LDL-receptor class A domain-containing protein 1 n=1 Tax=Holothuria leucospilota TaxID=206669 RepID=A0A9Q1CMR7_HOLLE|nr:MAM and LDL-receptor class A domain-containing protein 1 [Holothuria leucospilota]